MKMYFAAGEAYLDALITAGVQSMLFSFHYAGRKYWGDGIKDVVIDSGGFTARQQGTEISVLEYARYLNHYGVDFAFNLDTNCARQTQANQEYLENETETYIIPIYHYSDWVNRDTKGLLDSFCNRYPWIGLGGVAKVTMVSGMREALYDYVFERTGRDVRVHGLGIGKPSALLHYPWYSVDHTTWKSVYRYGRQNSVVPQDRLTQFRIDRATVMDKSVPEIRRHLRDEADATRWWSARGLTWSDLTKAEALSIIQ